MTPDFIPFVRILPRGEKGTGFCAYLDRCAHVAFVNGRTELEARQNLDSHAVFHEENIRRSMVILGLLPKSGKLDRIHKMGAECGLPVHLWPPRALKILA